MSRRRPDSPLPYSKVCDLAGDEAQLRPYLDIVTSTNALNGQHLIRAWEYAMALRTIMVWLAQNPLRHPPRILDLGGAGSHFYEVLQRTTSRPITLIDPDLPDTHQPPEGVRAYRQRIEDPLPDAEPFDIITCISVIEHVPEPRPFFHALTKLLAQGGLLFLTTDYWNSEGEDVAHFNWMRVRIYNEGRIKKLLTALRELGYTSFGPDADWSYKGPQVYDYSVCAVALQRAGGMRWQERDAKERRKTPREEW